MKKREYMQPTLEVVTISTTGMLAVSVQSVENDIELTLDAEEGNMLDDALGRSGGSDWN